MSDEEIFVKIDHRLVDLAPKFLAYCRLTVNEIREAADSGNFEVPRRIGHSLIGAGGSYGFDEINLIGAEIERAARAGDREALRKLAERLDSYVARVRPVFD
jgi:hypothetical protein